MREEAIRVWAFALRNLLMASRNIFFLFELTFWGGMFVLEQFTDGWLDAQGMVVVPDRRRAQTGKSGPRDRSTSLREIQARRGA